MSVQARRPTRSGLSGSLNDISSDRFDPLLLAEGEYWFRDHSCNVWSPQKRRLPAQLKVCSQSLYLVPRYSTEPILRLPYRALTALEELEGEASPTGEDLLQLQLSEHVRLNVDGRTLGYDREQCARTFRLSLVYISLEEALPLVQALASIELQRAAGDREAEGALRALIEEHESALRFNIGWLEEEGERVLAEAAAAAVTPLVETRGRVALSARRVYFQPYNLAPAAPVQSHRLDRVASVQRRRYQLRDAGLEIFFSDRESLYLSFGARGERDAFEVALLSQPALRPERMPSLADWRREWRAGRVSNYDYLMHLNRAAGRSFNDLTQYPVFPWVLADYESDTLDLNDPAVYRDLSRPVGALNERRLGEFLERFRELKRMAEDVDAAGGEGAFARAAAGNRRKRETRGRRDAIFRAIFASPGAKKSAPNTQRPAAAAGHRAAARGQAAAGARKRAQVPPPFMYGCHYSSPGYVVFYLLRWEPKLMLRLQNGRLDAPDRLFWSVADSWKSVLSLPSDVKELTPEFYGTDPTFLVGCEGQTFGVRSGGARVGPVVLPPWARDAPDFLTKMAAALESRHVSANLHRWIDLVFGYKSRGSEAERAFNVFHYLTYDEIALRYLEGNPSDTPGTLAAGLRTQMLEFGRTPRQLFRRPHPRRRAHPLATLRRLLCLAPVPPVLPSAPASAAARSAWGLRSGSSRHMPPASRAVFKVASRSGPSQRASLEWLETAASAREPGVLSLRATAGAEVALLARRGREAEAAVVERSTRRVSPDAPIPETGEPSDGDDSLRRAVGGAPVLRRAPGSVLHRRLRSLGGSGSVVAFGAGGATAGDADSEPEATLEAVLRAMRALTLAVDNHGYLLDSGAAELAARVLAAAPVGEEGAGAGERELDDERDNESEAWRAAVRRAGLATQILARLEDGGTAPRGAAFETASLRAVAWFLRRADEEAIATAAATLVATLARSSSAARAFFLERTRVVAWLTALVRGAVAAGAGGLVTPRDAPVPVRPSLGALEPITSTPGLGDRDSGLRGRAAPTSDAGLSDRGARAEAGPAPAAERSDAETALEALCTVAARSSSAAVTAAALAALSAVVKQRALRAAALRLGVPALVAGRCASAPRSVAVLRAAAEACASVCQEPEMLADVPMRPDGTGGDGDGHSHDDGNEDDDFASRTSSAHYSATSGRSPLTGLAALLARALAVCAESPDPDVQRHAAAALWHLAARPGPRDAVLAVEDGRAADALVALAAPERPSRARARARGALRVCWADQAARAALLRAASRRGVGREALERTAEEGGAAPLRRAPHNRLFSSGPEDGVDGTRGYGARFAPEQPHRLANGSRSSRHLEQGGGIYESR
ncbi:hypothetical protein QBZ16_002884 [Prototheca wickerhamii]|uniref:BEACH domain-containing protein n=1 Tax=Prototheca wickerhamii TaxID=3111 RepID=A0AAD9IJ16_PROWI|nr:hypothetical protein QBZ16_002884 [Prototheca wickerhamii]